MRPNPISLVLLIEDNADDEALTVRALKRLSGNLEVVVARDGQQAVELLDTLDRAPTLVLLDLKLPKLNGIEVLAHIRKHGRTAQVPVVMLTSSDEPSDLVACYRTGATAFVRKPVGYEEYVDAVRMIGRFWIDLNLRPVLTRA